MRQSADADTTIAVGIGAWLRCQSTAWQVQQPPSLPRPIGECRGRECGNQQLSHVISSSLLQVVHAVRLAVDRAAPSLVCLEHQASKSAERAWQVTIWARSDMQSLW